MVERRLRLVGIGPGHPDQLTVEAIEALRSVDYVIAADKGADDALLAARAEICRRYGEVPIVAVADPDRDRDPADYPLAVRDWHDARATAYEQVLLERPGDVAFLVWGDPAFYDSTIRIVQRIRDRGNVTFAYDVVPGVSSLQLLAARHRIVLHEVGRPLLLTTGRKLVEAVEAGHDNIVVLLDGRLGCLELDRAGWRIWWGANLGTPEERLVAGPLAEVADSLVDAREQAKASSGWVMDTYLLRRTTG